MVELYACDECGDPSCKPCFNRDDDGEYQDSVVSRWLCETHARQFSYCLWCGQYERSASRHESGFCDECEIDAIREENYGDDAD